MKLWTYTELKTKVEADLDLEGEDFITDSEMRGYCNEAIDEAEAEVLGIYEDYFLQRSTLTLVLNQEEYDLPSDIYAQKIRRMTFNNGSERYTVERVRDWRKFELYMENVAVNTADLYRYFIYSPSAGQSKILLTPKSRENGAFITIWYIRNANRIESDSDILDIPEAANFVMQYMKWRCYEKELNPSTQQAQSMVEAQRNLLVSTLTAMNPDAQNEIEADFSSYEEQH